jgi:hypothetical protein
MHERAHIDDACRLDRFPQPVGVVGRSRERLFAKNGFSRLGGGNRRLGVEVVGTSIDEEIDIGGLRTNFITCYIAWCVASAGVAAPAI